MSRNAKDTNRALFKRLEALLPPPDDLPRESSGLLLGERQGRWIGTRGLDSIWRKLIEESKMTYVAPLPGKHVLGLTHRGRQFVAFSAPPSERTAAPFMKGVSRTVNFHPGILTVLWGSTAFPTRREPDIGWQLANKVFGRVGKFGSWELRPYFEEVDLWELSLEAFPDMAVPDLLRTYGGYLTTHPELLNLNFSSSTLAKIRLLLEDFPGPIVADAIFRGLTATHWTHSFLEFYRCIEFLYNMPYIEELCTAMAYAHIPTQQVAQALRSVLGWKPNEENALAKLLSRLEGTSILAALFDSLPIHLAPSARPEDPRHKPTATAVYALRNGIAHFRPGLETDNHPRDWETLISVMCDVIGKLYSDFKASLLVSAVGQVM